jgi:gamma-glutamylcyclotransferase (GGCT)/AIG2-like uncharacterized protein YtfP
VTTDSEDYVWGELYEVNDPLNTLRRIDKAEDCDKGLFERKVVDVWPDVNEQVRAWSYFYAKPLEQSVQIKSGRFPIEVARVGNKRKAQ